MTMWNNGNPPAPALPQGNRITTTASFDRRTMRCRRCGVESPILTSGAEGVLSCDRCLAPGDRIGDLIRVVDVKPCPACRGTGEVPA
jgi:hypothetical protein